MSWEMISAPCAVAVEFENGDGVLMQGMGVD